MRYPRRLSSRRKAGSIGRFPFWCRAAARCRCPAARCGRESGAIPAPAPSAASRWPTDRRRTRRDRAPACGRAARARPQSRENGRTACAACSHRARPFRRRRRARLPRCRGRSRRRLRKAHPAEQRMREGVVPSRVPVGELPPRECRRRERVAAEQEEARVHAFTRERVEHPRGGARPGAVVEGEHQLLRCERQRRGKLLAPDPRRACDAHREHAFGAERVGIARARRRPSD